MENKQAEQLSEISTLLSKYVGKPIFIKLNNKTTIKGNLKLFDQHMNLCLTDSDVKAEEKTEQFNEMVLRGSTVLMVSFDKIPSVQNNEVSTSD